MINKYSTSKLTLQKIQIMDYVEQIAAVVPYGETVLHKAEDVYGYSKDKTLKAYNQTKGKIIQTKEGYLEFRKNVQKFIFGVVQQTVNQVLGRTENLVGIETGKQSVEDLKHAKERLQIIARTIFREYIMKSRVITNKQVQLMLKLGQNLTIDYIVPLYIRIRATVIVTWEMLIEFLQSRLKDIRLTYQSSKDHVTMFISGNFNEQALKQKVFEGIDQFKKFTVKVVNRTGLEIKVDRQSLMENYDKFAVHLLELMKDIREKGQGNIDEMKKKSKDLYKEVVSRIRAKQLEIKTQLKTNCPQLTQKSQ